jgi:hypothetical protein
MLPPMRCDRLHRSYAAGLSLTRVQCDFRDFPMRTGENIGNIRAQAVRGTAERECCMSE